jgi:hypothetical protein
VNQPGRINIAVIVEGHGEDSAVRTLLQRVWCEVLGGEHANVLRPIRRPRGSLMKEDDPDLSHAVDFAVGKLAAHGGGLVLILIDAEGECRPDRPMLGPTLLGRAKRARADVDVDCVFANVMYETWFVAAAESLGEYLLPPAAGVPEDPEADRLGKSWIKKHARNGKYAETADQPRFTAKMDLALCHRRSASFRKLCEKLARRLLLT